MAKFLNNCGDYVLCIKNNHKKLKEEIAAYFHKVTRDNPEHIQSHEEIDSGHGRIESRIYRQLTMTIKLVGLDSAQPIIFNVLMAICK